MSFVSFTPAARRDAPRAALVCACRSGPEGARVRAEGGALPRRAGGDFPGELAGTSPEGGSKDEGAQRLPDGRGSPASRAR